MKTGDLVRLVEHQFVPHDEKIYYRYGVIILLKDYGESGVWYQVQWNKEKLWHKASDLELLSED